MTDDEKMDEMIRRAAADYHRPPATPRDAMWEQIRARRAAAPAAGASAAGAPRGPARVLAFPVRRTAWMAAAAVALLTVGIGIGRRWDGSSAAPTGAVASSRPATVSAPATDGATEATAVPDETLPAPAAGGVLAAAPVAGSTPDASSSRAAGTFAAARPDLRVPGAPGMAAAPQASRAYQVATSQHLARVEALLTTYRAGARAGTVDAELSTWARDLLSTTRLLMDSPAASDPRRRRVLEDLELVLVQLVQLHPDGPAEERQLLDETLERGDVMTRLRSTLPADASAAGTE